MATKEEIVSLHQIVNGAAGANENQGKRIDDIGVDDPVR